MIAELGSALINRPPANAIKAIIAAKLKGKVEPKSRRRPDEKIGSEIDVDANGGVESLC